MTSGDALHCFLTNLGCACLHPIKNINFINHLHNNNLHINTNNALFSIHHTIVMIPA